MPKMESWPSGLRRRTANALVEKSPRRFKSYRLRVHDNDKLTQFLDATAELDDSEQSYNLEQILESCRRARKVVAAERLNKISDRTANDPVWRKED